MYYYRFIVSLYFLSLFIIINDVLNLSQDVLAIYHYLSTIILALSLVLILVGPVTLALIPSIYTCLLFVRNVCNQKRIQIVSSRVLLFSFD